MKRIRYILALVLSCIYVAAGAQTIAVRGKVTDATTGEGIPFAAVMVKGTSNGVSADADGYYSIDASEGSVLVFSSVGYVDAERQVKGNAAVNVSMNPDSESLDGTIVVAYGVQKKSSFVGAATQVSGEKLSKMQTSNISKSLEGAVAGLQTASSSGTPGSSSSMIIRGLGSVTASQSPLLVVDGVPYEGSLNSIPANDIESLTVLKDAAANSMYGARGSNGVIIITTKRGSSEKVKITFDGKVGFNSRCVPSYDVITDPGDYYEMAWEALRNAAYYRNENPMSLAQANAYASGALIKTLKYNVYRDVYDEELVDPVTGKLNPLAVDRKWTDNWNKDVFRNGIRQEYNLSASGGSEKTQVYLSASYLNDEGYVPNSGFDRVTVRAKVDQTISGWLKIGANISYANTVQQTYGGSSTSGVFNNLFYFGQSIAPIYPIYKYDLETGEKQYDAAGKVKYDWGESRAFGQLSNPYGQMMTSKSKLISDNLSTRGYIDIKILKDLKFTVNLSYDVFNQRSDVFQTPAGGDALNVNGRGDQETSRYTALNTNQLLNYTPQWGDHSLSVLVGHEIKKDNSYSLSAEMTNFLDPEVSDFANAAFYQSLTSSTTGYFLQGIFGRAEYSFDDRYFVSASYRTDASSRFAPDSRWGNFWSAGASWNIGRENFLSGASFLDYLKIKASYGTQGNDNIGITKVYEDLYVVDRVDGQPSLRRVFRAAPDVTWEKSRNFNAGVEAKFWDRLSVNADFFIKVTKDMIYYRPLALSQGVPSSQLVNDMDMKNTGIEFEVSADIFKTKNFYWNVTINGTHYKNALTKLPSDKPAEGYEAYPYYRSKGGSLYDYFLYEWAGVNPKTGLSMYAKYTENADGTETVSYVTTTAEATRRRIGKTSIPDIYGGFSTSLRFFGFDVSATFAYQIGGWTMDSNYASLMSAGSLGTNWHKDIFRRWTPQNTDTAVPRVQDGFQEANQMSTRFLTKSSYLSLRNATVGYTIPAHLLSKAKIQNLRIFLTGDNLWYISYRRGLDVRQSFSGSTGFTYSALRTVSGGVSLTF
ncbi:MAG: SusC/RagA family TonB-linked outer membrane protein [Candidatus Cryptobacteroides sp.]